MIFPIGDDNVVGGAKPIISYSFLALNIAIYLIQTMVPGNLVCEFAAIPNDVVGGKNIYTVISSMFLHGSWMHLLGNMLFLWIFGDNIEACIGNIRFLLFYLVGGIVASLVHIGLGHSSADQLIDCCNVCAQLDPCGLHSESGITPCAGSIPSLGASGAISAVMGAYLVMFPKSRIKMIFLIFFRKFYIPAYVFLLFWFGEQLFGVFSGGGLFGGQTGGGVAWWAHIGGFVFGLLIGFLYKSKAKMKHPEIGSSKPFV